MAASFQSRALFSQLLLELLSARLLSPMERKEGVLGRYGPTFQLVWQVSSPKAS